MNMLQFLPADVAGEYGIYVTDILFNYVEKKSQLFQMYLLLQMLICITILMLQISIILVI